MRTRHPKKGSVFTTQAKSPTRQEPHVGFCDEQGERPRLGVGRSQNSETTSLRVGGATTKPRGGGKDKAKLWKTRLSEGSCLATRRTRDRNPVFSPIISCTFFWNRILQKMIFTHLCHSPIFHTLPAAATAARHRQRMAGRTRRED